MACKYKYNNNWYSKEELQSILYKERGIDKYGKLVKPEIKNKINKEVIRVELSDPYETKLSDKTFISEQEAKDWIKKESEKQDKYYEEIDQDPIYKWEYKIVIQKQGISPKITNETLKESINSVKKKLNNLTPEQIKELNDKVENGEITDEEEYNAYIFDNLDKINKKEYTSQALINTKIAALKEVAKKYPRSLIRSEVRPINDAIKIDSFFQKINNNENAKGLSDTTNFEDLFSPDNVKPGVFQVFEENPELASISTQEQYSQYLDTIFPDSKVKDIVYRSDKPNLEKFSSKYSNSNFGFHSGIFLSTDIDYLKKEYGNHIYSTLIDIKNLVPTKIPLNKETVANILLENESNVTDLPYWEDLSEEEKEKTFEEFENNRKVIDGVVGNDSDSIGEDLRDEIKGKEYVVNNEKQIHILGSKKDVEGFKNFVNNNQIDNVSLSNPITNVDLNC